MWYTMSIMTFFSPSYRGRRVSPFDDPLASPAKGLGCLPRRQMHVQPSSADDDLPEDPDALGDVLDAVHNEREQAERNCRCDRSYKQNGHDVLCSRAGREEVAERERSDGNRHCEAYHEGARAWLPGLDDAYQHCSDEGASRNEEVGQAQSYHEQVHRSSFRCGPLRVRGVFVLLSEVFWLFLCVLRCTFLNACLY